MFDAETLRPNVRYHVLALLAEHLGEGRRKQLVETEVTLVGDATERGRTRSETKILFAQGFLTGAGNATRVLLLVNKGGAVVTAAMGRGWSAAAGMGCMATSVDARMGLYDEPVARPCPPQGRIDVGPWGVTLLLQK